MPAWAEREYFRFTGYTTRIHHLLEGKHPLEHHYEFLENCSDGTPDPAWGAIPLSWRKTVEGYRWSGYSSGMDNTPRGRDDWNGLLWFDAIAQQGLAACSIAELAAIIGNEPLKKKFLKEYQQKTELLQRYWNLETAPFRTAGTALSAECSPRRSSGRWSQKWPLQNRRNSSPPTWRIPKNSAAIAPVRL